MTFNKDGSVRKLRVNKPTNFKWTEEYATLAYCCYRSEANLEVLKEISEKLGVSHQAVITRVGEFKIFSLKGRTEKVCEMTELVYKKNSYRTFEECDRKVNSFLEDTAVEVEAELEEILQASSSIPIVETKAVIQQVIDNKIVDIGGPYINSENLVILKNEESLNFIEGQSEGCYFIFSTMPLDKVPVMSENGDKAHEASYLIKEGEKYHCLYNGKSNSVRERLKVHLFNSHTLEKVKSGEASTICGTGAMSLISLTQVEFDELEKAGKYNPSKHKLKPVRKSIQNCSIDQREDHSYFLNGIDVTEAQWKQYKFAVVVLRSDSEFGKILIEEAFCVKNGRPPLCKRHG